MRQNSLLCGGKITLSRTAFTFLMAVSLQKRGVRIQKDVFRRLDPIDLMTENAEDPLELKQGILIQTIEKTRHLRLVSKGVLAQDRAEHRIRGKLIHFVVIEKYPARIR